MSHQTELTKVLNVEDFRRLGVRPNEVRLSVIRGAASRNAIPLANQLLALSGDDSWLQLSRVVTSTYRLLDPRLRPNAHQRAYIGRILPLTLNTATTSRFQAIQPRFTTRTGGQPTPGPTGSDAGPVPPPVSHVFRSPEIASEAFAAPTTQLADAEIWQLSLDDRDLASGSRLRRQGKTANRNIWVWSSMVACGVLVGSILGWNSLSKKSDAVTAIQQNDPTAVQSPPAVASSVASLAAPTAMAQRPLDEQPGQAEPTALESEMPIASLPSNIDYLAIDPASADALVETTASSVPKIKPSMATPSLETSLGSENAVQVVEAEMVKAVPDVEQGLFPVPQPEDVAIARQRLLQSINTTSITHVNFKTVRDWVADARSGFSPGAIDHYTAASMLGSFAWLESGPRQPSLSTMTSRLDAYQVDETTVWTQSYIDASDHVTLPEDLNQFFTAGFGLIETLIKHEALDQASEVLTQIQQRGDQFSIAQEGNSDSGENDLQTLITSYRKSLKYADRISTTAQRVVRLHGEIESIPADVSGGSSLGRYYCLVLGDWCQGLRFMAKTSDPRLAALAKSELDLLTVDPFLTDPVAWSQIADQCLLAADRLSGRAANQVRLHAIELLEQSSRRATAVAKIEARQRTEVILQQLPLHLTLDQEAADANTVIPNSVPNSGAVAATAEVKSANQPVSKQETIDSGGPEQVNDWLVGRINISDEDLGVRLRYQLDVAINQPMLESIERQLRRPLKDAVIEFRGDFNCKEDQWVILALSPPSDTLIESVFVNGEPIQLDPIDHSARLQMRAGEHSLRWQITLTDTQSTLSCSLRDAQSGQRLELTTSPKQVDSASTGDMSVSVMRNQ